jgi:glycosyltransferase involved in cell wall biosynthesis
MTSPRRILYVVNDAPFFLSHRLPLAEAASRAGYEVHVAVPEHGSMRRISEAGLRLHSIPFLRRGMNPVKEVRTFMALLQLYRRLRPDLVHHATIKPNLYGGMAARLVKLPAAVTGVTGLGYVFMAKGWRAAVVRGIVQRLYGLALKHRNSRVVFENPDDRTLFLKNRIIPPEQAALIKGSGVSMDRFFPRPEVPGLPLVVIPCRMLWDKGVGEFVAAAALLRARGIRARFALVGDSDPDNPSMVPVSQLQQWHAQGVVEWWGYQADMADVFAASHIVCLPSYGEGLSKALTEAAACGRPIVTTDVAGCREIVRHHENGLLVPPRDAKAVADALARLIESPELRRRMGRRGRQIAVEEFAVERVVAETLAIYRTLLTCPPI